MPHRRGTGKRVFVPVAEVAEAFSADLEWDPASWLADLENADADFGNDVPTDPFGSAQR